MSSWRCRMSSAMSWCNIIPSIVMSVIFLYHILLLLCYLSWYRSFFVACINVYFVLLQQQQKCICNLMWHAFCIRFKRICNWLYCCCFCDMYHFRWIWNNYELKHNILTQNCHSTHNLIRRPGEVVLVKSRSDCLF